MEDYGPLHHTIQPSLMTPVSSIVLGLFVGTCTIIASGSWKKTLWFGVPVQSILLVLSGVIFLVGLVQLVRSRGESAEICLYANRLVIGEFSADYQGLSLQPRPGATTRKLEFITNDETYTYPFALSPQDLELIYNKIDQYNPV